MFSVMGWWGFLFLMNIKLRSKGPDKSHAAEAEVDSLQFTRVADYSRIFVVESLRRKMFVSPCLSAAVRVE